MIVALFVGKLLEWQIDGHFYSTIISTFSEIQNAHRQDTITGKWNINTRAETNIKTYLNILYI